MNGFGTNRPNYYPYYLQLRPGPNNDRNVGIVVIGDSHPAGSMQETGTEKIGLLAFASPKDRGWSGTAEVEIRSDNSIMNAPIGSQDPNIGVTLNIGSFTAWIPFLLRAALGPVPRTRLANCGFGGASFYTWAGEQANGYLEFDGVPNEGDTADVGNDTYTFRAVPAADYDVAIALTPTGNAINLCNAINHENAGYFASTPINPDCFCPNIPGSAILHIFALRTGPAGNALALSTVAPGTISVLQGFLNGSDTSATFTEAVGLVPVGFGRVDIVIVCLGTNDALRPGYRGRETAYELAKLLAHIAVAWPSAKVVLWRPPVSGAGAAATVALATRIIPAIDVPIAAGSVTGVDIYGLGAGAGQVTILATDGTHLSDYAASLAASLEARGIAEALRLV